MAPKKKSHHVQNADSQASSYGLEKKIKALYDYVDYGNYKRAVQESDRVLKKFGNSLHTKILKTLALIRLGRVEEGRPILQEVFDSNPTDEAILQVLGACCKETNQFDKLALMYENATAAFPKNDEFLSHLFMAQVRLSQFKKQQQTALRLHKINPKSNPYYYWSVMSVVMQSVEAEDKLAKAMFLPLAEKMAKTRRSDLSPVELNAETTLLCMILEKQGKYSEVLDVMKGEMGQSLSMDDRVKQTQIAELCMKADQSTEARQIYLTLLNEDADHWNYYTRLLDISDADESLILEKSESIRSSGVKQRSPLLAASEVHYRRLVASNYTQHYSALLESLLEYIKVFGNKPCCYKDVCLYFECLIDHSATNSTTPSQILEQIQQTLNLPAIDQHYQEKNDIQRHIIYLLLWRHSGELESKLSDTERLKLAVKLYAMYLQAAKTVEQETRSSEIKACDSYVLLSAFILSDLYKTSGEVKHVLQALAYLEQAITISTCTHQISLVMLHLYTLLGAIGPVVDLVGSMEIKMVLYEPLGYLFADPFIQYGHWSSATLRFTSMLKYYINSTREICDGLIACYQYGTFSKIEEFYRMKDRIQNSLQYHSVRTEQRLISLLNDTTTYDALALNVSYMEGIPHTELPADTLLTDSRDIPIVESWLPQAKLYNSELRENSFNEQKLLLTLRHTTLRLLASGVLLVESCSTVSSNDAPSPGANLNDLVTRLLKLNEDHVKLCQDFKPLQAPMFSHHSTRLSDLITVMSPQLHAWFKLVQTQVAMLKGLDTTTTQTDIMSCYTSLGSTLAQSVSSLADTDRASLGLVEGGSPDCIKIKRYLERLVTTAELVGYASLLCGMYWKLNKMIVPINKKRNKTAPSPGPSLHNEDLHKSTSGLRGLITTVNTSFNKVKDAADILLCEDLIKAIQSLRLDNSDSEGVGMEETVSRNISLSYERSARELIDFISSQHKFLSTLSL